MIFFWSKLFPRYEDRMAAMARMVPNALRTAERLTLAPTEEARKAAEAAGVYLWKD